MGVMLGPVTVTELPLILAGSIGLLNVMLIALRPAGTLITPHPGVVDNTVGGVSGAVVKLHPVLPTELTPRALFAAEVMVTLNRVLNARLLVGVKVATLLGAS